MEIKIKTGQELRQFLDEYGIKQSWFAEKLNCSTSHLSNVLSDRVAMTGLLKKMAADVILENFGKQLVFTEN